MCAAPYTHAAEYWAERCEMMQVWADQLDQWREGGQIITAQFGRPSEASGAV
jgi:hypothetical protein